MPKAKHATAGGEGGKEKPAKMASRKTSANAARRPAQKTAPRKAAKKATTRKPAQKAAAGKSVNPSAGKTAKKATSRGTPKAAQKVARGKQATKGARNANNASARLASAGPADNGTADTPRPAAGKSALDRPVGGTAARLRIGTADEQTITREDGRYTLPSTVNVELPDGYKPGAKEEYMNPRQLAYFRRKLKHWRDQLVEESRQTMENLREEVRDVGDDAERATRETENSLELRTRDRYRKLIFKIEQALRRIEEGRYGYCEETDEEIGLDRLEARPIATLSLDAQERREHLRKQMGD